MEIIQGLGVEVKKGVYQYFELNGEKGKRDLKKMRVSQNYVRGLRIRNFTSTPFEDGGKNYCFKEVSARKPLMNKALLGGGEVKK